MTRPMNQANRRCLPSRCEADSSANTADEEPLSQAPRGAGHVGFALPRGEHGSRIANWCWCRRARRAPQHFSSNLPSSGYVGPTWTAQATGSAGLRRPGALMTWGVSTARRRPGELLTRGDVCHVHATRDAAERCGAAVEGAPDLVRLERCTERVWRVLWSLSDTSGGELRRPPVPPAGPAGARAAADRGGGVGRGHDPGRGGCARCRSCQPAAAPGWGPVMTAPPRYIRRYRSG